MIVHPARRQETPAERLRDLFERLRLTDLDWVSVLMLIVVPLGIAALLGLGRMPVALGLLAALCGGAFGVVIVRHASLETIMGWAMLPVVLLYPPSRTNIGSLPPINTLRGFLAMVLIGLLFLYRPDKNAPKSGWFTWAYRALVVGLLVITFLSAAFVNDPVNDPVGSWATGPLLILLAGVLGTFVGSPGTLLIRLSQAARPLAFLLAGIAVFEYIQSSSLYGISMRINGFDRRVPGPFYSAEVFGYFFSVLAAFILYHFRQTTSRFARTVDLFALLACIIGAALTFFRSSWLSLIMVFVLDALLHLPSRQWWRRHAATLIVAAPILLAGGVAANTALRAAIVERATLPVRYPPIWLCTDNAAMIGAAGFFAWEEGRRSDWGLDVVPSLALATA